MRAVAEAFECYVDWNGDTKTVTINSDGKAPYEAGEYETEILGGRLIGILPHEAQITDYGWGYPKELYSTLELSIDDIRSISITADDYLCITVGDIEEDVKNLRFTPVGGSEVQNNGSIEFLEVKPYLKGQDSSALKRRFVIKLTDGTIAVIQFDSSDNSLKFAESYNYIVYKFMETLKYGGKTFDLSAKEVRIGDMIIEKPEGFVAYPNRYAEAFAYKLEKPVPSSEYPYCPNLEFWVYSAGNALYSQSSNWDRKITSELFGKKVTWWLYKENYEFLAHLTLRDKYVNAYIRAEGNADSEEERSTLIAAAATAKLTDEWVDFTGIDMTESDKTD